MSTDGLLQPIWRRKHNQLMVDASRPVGRLRFMPAPAPNGYATFRAWLIDTVEPPGVGKLKAELGRFINAKLNREHGAQMVNTYIARSSVPERPVVRCIAEWAQVDYDALQSLAGRQEEAKQSAPKERASTGRVRSFRKKTSSQKPARSGS